MTTAYVVRGMGGVGNRRGCVAGPAVVIILIILILIVVLIVVTNGVVAADTDTTDLIAIDNGGGLAHVATQQGRTWYRRRSDG